MKMSARTLLWPVLIIGLIARLIFIGSDGFHNDIAAFESWSMTVAEKGYAHFYGSTGFADYPPGYFYILGVIGWVYDAFVRHLDPGFRLLGMMVKLPAIIADLLVGLLLFKIVRRFSDERWALGAAALYVLNPISIWLSSMWGQVDVIAGGLALLALYLFLRAEDDETTMSRFVVGAWAVFACSLLIKPQAAILIPLFIAWACIGGEKTRARLIATAYGIGGAFVIAAVVAAPFHPTWNLIDLFSWLYGRYAVGLSIYPDGSVNAFNLWAIHSQFWQPDSIQTLFMPQSFWAIILTIAATAFIIWRYVQVRTQAVLMESATLLLLAFFMLSSRMHERYIFDGLLFTVASIGVARRYLWAAFFFTVTTYANLTYSYQYQAVLTQHTQGVNPLDLWGFGDHLLAFANVAAFFVLSYVFLGGETSIASSDAKPAKGIPATASTEPSTGQRWFDPREGLIGMRSWIDWAVASGLGVVSFVLSYINYNVIHEKIFDEIYFARAGAEYLTPGVHIYENTHPPLTKLLISLSMMLFGGMHGGNNATGWRFLDVVFGALVIVLLYIFAKRITGSIFFAALASIFFICDGMHFAQSRIATPEGFVVFFSVAAVYAFYRFWIAAQTSVRKASSALEENTAIYAAVASLVLAQILSFGIVFFFYQQSAESAVVAGVWGAFGLYLLARLLVIPMMFPTTRKEFSYADGSVGTIDGDRVILDTPDGGSIDSAAKTARLGARSSTKGGNLTYTDEDLQIAYGRDGSAVYMTPENDATFTPGVITVGDAAQRGKDARFWLIAFTVALGCVVASKWYGVMGFGVSFLIIALVWFQQFLTTKRAALWGNPRGFRIDVAVATIVFISATVYGLVWIPDLARHADIKSMTDVVIRQHSMYNYHHNLVATHPYESNPWQWPLDARPIAYYYHDFRTGAAKTDNKACCVAEILSLPNPITLWLGLITIPFLGFLAWKERNKGYALIVITYLMQWLPWFASPRLVFIYHFYANVPLICLSVAISLQWLWRISRAEGRWFATAAIAAVTLSIVGAFIFFYPILAGTHIPWDAWDARMWMTQQPFDWV